MKSVDVANAFIRRHGQAMELTNLKLNKLVYYAQVESLRASGSSLFDDPIEAWQYGPVEPAVYRTFRKYGRRRILHEEGHCVSSAQVDRIVDAVARSYGNLTAYDLVNWSHREGGAWHSVYRADKDVEITADDIIASDDIKGLAHDGRTFASRLAYVRRSIPNALRLLENS